MMSSIFALWAGLLIGMGGPVTGVAITPDAERTRVLISVDGEVEYRHFTMEGPSRLVVDVFGARHALPRDEYLGIHRGGVVSVRTSQYTPDVVRVVLELTEPNVPYDIMPEEGRIRIALASASGPFEPWATGQLPTDFLGDGEPGTGMSQPAAPDPAAGASSALQQVPADRINITFPGVPVLEVIQTFAEFANRSIVASPQVTGNITATVNNQPWDEAFETIMNANGFQVTELPNGIIRVDAFGDLTDFEQGEPLESVVHRISYATAAEVATALQGLIPQGEGGPRGSVQAMAGANAVLVTATARVQDQIRTLIQGIDLPTPQVTIQAKIIFVNRTDLNEFGVTYDLKDSAGNQLNVVAPGAIDADGDGVIELPDEQVPTGENVVSLGGNSVAALGNANNRVAGPTLTLLNSLIIGRHTLITFVEALESVNLSDIQAKPMVRVLDNQTANIQVGESTPIRVVDAGGAGGAGGLPTAQVTTQETGIILEATPHITAANTILLELHAERSAPQLAESDAGFIFQTQEATTRVLVQDGQTVVIGGLTVTETSEVRSGIPLLMDLPVIGGLFRVTRESQIQRDLIILVTPHIVQDQF